MRAERFINFATEIWSCSVIYQMSSHFTHLEWKDRGVGWEDVWHYKPRQYKKITHFCNYQTFWNPVCNRGWDPDSMVV